jgi:hypothetical protein
MMKVRSGSTLIPVSLERAQSYLQDVARGPADRFCAQTSLDPGFRDVVPRSKARETVRQLTGVDPGFDFGEDAFSAMIGLALSATADTVVPRRLLTRFAEQIARCRDASRYGYFIDVPEFAADTDCTALAGGAMYEHGRLTRPELIRIADELVRAAAPPEPQPERGSGPRVDAVQPGVVLVYWDEDAGRAERRARKHDPVVCANVLYTLSLARPWHIHEARARVVAATTRYVDAHLNSNRYLRGTRYYPDPNAFLFAVSRLCQRFEAYTQLPGDSLRRHLLGAPHLEARNPLSLALSILAAHNVGAHGARCEEQREALARCQQDDGSWAAAPYYRMGRFPVYFGSPLVTTLFAVQALQSMEPSWQA